MSISVRANSVRRWLGLLTAAPLLLAACGGQTPISPSTANSGTGGGSGAVIVGVVTGLGAQASASTSSASGTRPLPATPSAATSMSGLTVTVVGSSLSSAVNDAGRFELANVPAGRVQLRFASSGINATATIGDVAKDQFIQIEIQVGPDSAVVIAEERTGKVSLCHVEGNGTYHPITVSESAEQDHRAHGDGKVGDPVPGQALKTFNASCQAVGPSIDIEKSTNGEDADDAPGPSIRVGAPVTWSYVVANTGTVDLTGITVVDDKGVILDCQGKTSLTAGASMTCTGAGVATLGQYSNVGTATASWTMASGSGTVTDSDASHYLGVTPDDDESPKVTLCHKTGNGKFVTLSVSVSAEPAHRAHGDGSIGDAIPGMTGKVFGAGCSVQ